MTKGKPPGLGQAGDGQSWGGGMGNFTPHLCPVRKGDRGRERPDERYDEGGMEN